MLKWSTVRAMVSPVRLRCTRRTGTAGRYLTRWSACSGNRRESECGHFLAVANQQRVADQRRMIPGLAVERLESCQLPELAGRRADERELALFRQHDQQILIREQDHLTVAVAPALPLARPVFEADARQDVAVESERVAFVHDEVVEVRLEAARL